MTVRQLLTSAALVVSMAIVVGAVAHVISNRQPHEYQASAQLLFNPRMDVMQAIGYPTGPQDHGAAVTDNVLQVRSYDVARATAAVLPDPWITAAAVYSAISVGAAGDVVTIVAQAGSPRLAAQI